mmetsp:Transcript_39747/g.84994  ORF Transcript_39747/g.84994 Transcript_39747/m.84994 type:complete len:262 (+) Transcript_39747:1765-2550(+)
MQNSAKSASLLVFSPSVRVTARSIGSALMISSSPPFLCATHIFRVHFQFRISSRRSLVTSCRATMSACRSSISLTMPGARALESIAGSSRWSSNKVFQVSTFKAVLTASILGVVPSPSPRVRTSMDFVAITTCAPTTGPSCAPFFAACLNFRRCFSSIAAFLSSANLASVSRACAIASAVVEAAFLSAAASKFFTLRPACASKMAAVSPLPQSTSIRRRRSQSTRSPRRMYQSRVKGMSPPMATGTKAWNCCSIGPWIPSS